MYTTSLIINGKGILTKPKNDVDERKGLVKYVWAVHYVLQSEIITIIIARYHNSRTNGMFCRYILLNRGTI